MKVLLLSAYTAVSHQYWIDGLQKNLPEIEWTVLSLPPRYFSWRIRGNSLTWAYSEREVLEQPYDLVLATSMVDLSTLRGMVPNLSTIPSIVYFHENQFVYPVSDQVKDRHQGLVEAQLVNLYSALCADTIVFNSGYNRDSFVKGVDQLLRKLPDGVPPGVVDRLRSRSQVLAVPLRDPLFLEQKSNTQESDLYSAQNQINLVWNHRWEYDKGPDQLLAVLQKLATTLPLKVHVIGQQFRQQPDVFKDIQQLLLGNGWQGEWGFIANKNDYLALLRQSQIVLSTALHDFQGLSILEGFALGCIPVVPDRLAYPEYIPSQFRYPSLENDRQEESRLAANLISETVTRLQHEQNIEISPRGFACGNLSWSSLGASYRSLFESSARQ